MDYSASVDLGKGSCFTPSCCGNCQEDMKWWKVHKSGRTDIRYAIIGWDLEVSESTGILSLSSSARGSSRWETSYGDPSEGDPWKDKLDNRTPKGSEWIIELHSFWIRPFWIVRGCQQATHLQSSSGDQVYCDAMLETERAGRGTGFGYHDYPCDSSELWRTVDYCRHTKPLWKVFRVNDLQRWCSRSYDIQH